MKLIYSHALLFENLRGLSATCYNKHGNVVLEEMNTTVKRNLNPSFQDIKMYWWHRCEFEL